MKSPTTPGRNARSRSTGEPPASIRVTRRFRASSERVFDAWLGPEVAGRWLFATASRPMTDVAIEARVGGAFRFADRRHRETIAYSGEYLEIVPPRRLVFTLSVAGDWYAVTRVTVEITPLRTGCELSLTHDNLPPDRAEHTAARWTGILFGLGVTLKSTVGRGDSNRGRVERASELSISGLAKQARASIAPTVQGPSDR
jgi:uncharacterized protein YndB with AHSA1/START domain